MQTFAGLFLALGRLRHGFGLVWKTPTPKGQRDAGDLFMIVGKHNDDPSDMTLSNGIDAVARQAWIANLCALERMFQGRAERWR